MKHAVQGILSALAFTGYIYGSACLWVWGHPVWMVVGFFFPPIPMMAAAIRFVPEAACK